MLKSISIFLRLAAVGGLLFLYSCGNSGSGGNNARPVASNGTLTVVEDTVQNGILVATDTEGDVLTYTIVSNGTKGTAITNATGEYTYTPNSNATGSDSFTFQASDGKESSNIATIAVSITPVNDAPVSNAGLDQEAIVGELVTLDGSSSNDPDGDSITYLWSFTAKPAGSVATLSSALVQKPSFTPDLPGTYAIQLTVNDTVLDSIADPLSVISKKSIKIPDTGQTTSYTATFGEDHDYTNNPPFYTDNGNGTVTDNVTGLMWQQTDDNTTRIWDAAITYCFDLILAGYTDWRLPEIKELTTIVSYGVYKPAINPVFITKGASYWSSTTDVSSTSLKWDVHFSHGFVFSEPEANNSYVRCVR